MNDDGAFPEVPPEVLARIVGRPESRADDPIIRKIVEETIQEAGGVVALNSDEPDRRPLPCETLQLGNGWTLEVPIKGPHKAEAVDILRGRYVRRLEDVIGSKRPRRVLDLGAGVGAFAAWAGIAWPFSWVDCYERDMQLAEVCRRNLPPGGKMLSEAELLDVDVSKYAVIRVGDLAVMQSGAILDAVAVLIVDAVRE